MSIGTRIKEKRIAMGMTQKQLADKLGVKNTAIANYETGVSSPKESILFKLFEVLQCDANYLFQDDIKIDESKAFAQTNKYDNITALLDQLNPKGIDEAERHTKYLTTQEEYKKNNTKSSTKTIKLKTAEEITSSRMAAFGGMVEDENLRQKLIDQAEKQRQENKNE